MSETTRELDARWETLTFEEKKAIIKHRREALSPVLRERLKPGDRLRATKAECSAHEATFEFSHWEGGWIVSKSGRSISPGNVYSVNGDVLRA